MKPLPPMKPDGKINYRTGRWVGYSPVEWVILGLCFLVLAILVSALAGCSGVPGATEPGVSGPVIDWIAPTAQNGVKGWLASDDARAKWLTLLPVYGKLAYPPADDAGWTSLGNGQWFVTDAAQLAFAQMNWLRENPGKLPSIPK